jgi:hypothetical protein
MIGASSGIFWIDSLCKPAVKQLLHHPLLALLLVCLVYGYVAYRVVKAAYLADHNY